MRPANAGLPARGAGTGRVGAELGQVSWLGVWQQTRDPSSGLGAERWLVHLRGRVAEGYAGSGKNVDAELAAAFGPLIVLLGQDGADQPDQ